MTIDLNDPRITAYALGELEGADRETFERELADSPEAQAEVDALETLGAQLESELRRPSMEGLDAERRATIVSAAPPAERWPLRRLLPLAAAAGLLLGVGVIYLFGESQSSVSTTKTAAERSQLMASDGPEDALRSDPRGGLLPRREVDVDELAPGEAWAHVYVGEKPGLEAEPAPVADPALEPASVPSPVTPAATPSGHDVFAGSSGNPTGIPFRGGGPTDGSSSQPQGMQGRPGAGPAPVFRLRPPTMGQPAAGPVGLQAPGYGSARYVQPTVEPFRRVTRKDGHTSTFAVDVDTASYANVRRMLRSGHLPPSGAVRIEELVNYFDYDYAGPEKGSTSPFRTHVQIATCPWNPKHRLARIALKGREVTRAARPAANLVFLVDVSGSMDEEDKLPLVRSGLLELTENLRKDDRVAIVTYAATANVVLASTPGSEREAILGAIRALRAGGGTNGAGGIQAAYAEAQKGFQKEGVNRVILCTDGDFNVGVSDTNGLVRLIAAKAKTGVYLSVLGYGTGNFQDGEMEALSNRGNGNYAYIDSQQESARVLVEQMEGTLVTIAKDVKFQLWFNPKTVAGWRLLGYENRRLAARDFNDDSKDAGDIGAGHEVTALYEIIPTGAGVPGTVDPNPFVNSSVREARAKDAPTPEPQALFIWRLRWKAPDGNVSKLVERNVSDAGWTFERADRDFQWAAAVGAYGMLLRADPHAAQASWALVRELAKPAVGEDPKGRRAEFLDLVQRAQALRGGR